MTSNRTKTRNAGDKTRGDIIKETGCVVAKILGFGYVYPEIHHLLHAGRVIGHRATVGLNTWSHRGVPFPGWSAKRCEEKFGPSLAKSPKAFHEMFPDTLLLKVQNETLREYLSLSGLPADSDIF